MPKSSPTPPAQALFASEQPDLLEKSYEEERATQAAKPVECFGQTFANDAARREHYLGLLTEKLKDPAFRKTDGFPIGSDEDIIALSDPPYFTACPNPWLLDFVSYYGTSYDSQKSYHREPYVTDISEGKNHPIYNAHSYHTKVPHRAIMQYILHYTEPGDLIFDGFCGTGMTGVAAQLCGSQSEVQELGFRIERDGTILGDDGKPFSKLGSRKAVLNDLSPAASFIAQNYNIPLDSGSFQTEAFRVLNRLKAECEWMYQTRQDEGQEREVTYTIWSDVFNCPECGGEIIFWDEAVDSENEKVRDSIQCPHCNAEGLTKDKLIRCSETVMHPLRKALHTSAKRVPVLIEYLHNGKRRTKRPDHSDLALLSKINSTPPPVFYPDVRIDKDIDLWYERDYRSLGVSNVYDFFSYRALLTLGAFKQIILSVEDRRLRTAFIWILTSVVEGSSLMNRERPGGMPSKLSGTLYIGGLIREINILSFISRKMKKILAVSPVKELSSVLSTQSSTVPTNIPDNSFDYIFIDPPFGSNIIYSDLSILWEGWLGLFTNTTQEAVVHRRKKTHSNKLPAYQKLMLAAFKEAFRILKPGRWMTVEFSNTQASVWNAIQISLEEAGFVVANVSFIDKQSGSFKAVTTPTAVKQDPKIRHASFLKR